MVADVGLELLPDGRPAYRAVRFTVPRQSGKTELILAWELQRALGWVQMLGEPQRLVYSAQTGKDAREKLLEDQVPVLERNKKLLGNPKVTRAMGSEAVLWANGSRLVLLASSEDSGHGKTVDFAVKDELFADVDNRRDQALIPAMSTKPFAQVLTASTMGTSESLALNAEVETGRRAAENDQDTGIAYFEWSAAPEDDPDDQAVWWRCMPALGRTITLEVVEHAYQTLKLDEFRRAYLNIPTASDDRVIPAKLWAAVCDPDLEATAGAFALDINPERSAAAIVAAGDGPVVELVDFRPGVQWVVDRCVELTSRYRAPLAIDKTGQAGSFVPDLQRRGVRVVELDSKDMQHACGEFFDAVADGLIRVRQNADLDASVAGACKRVIGDAFVWGRKSSRFDVSPLCAATIAKWLDDQGRRSATPFVLR